MEGKGRKGETRRKDGRKAGRQEAAILPTAHSVSLTLQVFLDTATPILAFRWISPLLAARLGIETEQDSGHEFRRAAGLAPRPAGPTVLAWSWVLARSPGSSVFARMAREGVGIW